jgi:hypothetical protein
MRKQSIVLVAATVLVSAGVALAQNQTQTPQQYDKSGAPSGLQSTTPDQPPVVTLPEANGPAPDARGAPVSETTGQAPKFDDRWSPGQAPKFEDRWSAQGGVPYLPPNATLPNPAPGE